MGSRDPERANDGALPEWRQRRFLLDDLAAEGEREEREQARYRRMARDFTNPDGQGKTTLHFHVATRLDRHQVADLRDAITDTLATVLGIRLSLTDDGTEVYLAAGAATLGDVITQAPEGTWQAGFGAPPATRHCAACDHLERGHRTLPGSGGSRWPPEALFCPQCPGETCRLERGQVTVIGPQAAAYRSGEVSHD